jgi:hypothetical protein
MPEVIQILFDSRSKLREEAIWAVCNFFDGANKIQKSHLIDNKVFYPLLSCLSKESDDLCQRIIDTVEKLLKEQSNSEDADYLRESTNKKNSAAYEIDICGGK